MSRNTFALRPGENLVKEDFADATISAPITANSPTPRVEHRRGGLYYSGPFHQRKAGRLYLTDQRYVHAIWPKYNQVIISRKLEQNILNRLYKPMVLIDIPLSGIAEIRLGGIFKSSTAAELTFAPGYVQISVQQGGKQWKNLQYQPQIEWSEWESAFQQAFRAQHLRLTEVRDEPKKIDSLSTEEMEQLFNNLANKRWKVEKA